MLYRMDYFDRHLWAPPIYNIRDRLRSTCRVIFWSANGYNRKPWRNNLADFYKLVHTSGHCKTVWVRCTAFCRNLLVFEFFFCNPHGITRFGELRNASNKYFFFVFHKNWHYILLQFIAIYFIYTKIFILLKEILNQFFLNQFFFFLFYYEYNDFVDNTFGWSNYYCQVKKAKNSRFDIIVTARFTRHIEKLLVALLTGMMCESLAYILRWPLKH